MLRLKAYIGIKTYTVKGELKEAKAVWPAIVDEATFKRVNKQLDHNKSGYKPFKDGKFPYLLSGLVFCEKCHSQMPGKSATGYSGKVGYHEHSWATKRDSALSKKMFKCDPHRVPSKKLDPLVWEKVVAYVTDTCFMKKVLLKVREHHEKDPFRRDLEQLRAKICGINSQIDALSERLSELPKTVSAAPIYKQMEKLQDIKSGYEQQVQVLKNGGKTSYDRIVGLDTLESFSRHYKEFVGHTATFPQRRELVKKFVSKIEVGVDRVKIHFIVDQDHYKQEMALRKLAAPGGKSASSYCLTSGAPGQT